MRSLRILILLVLIGSLAHIASASFIVNVQQDTVTPPTDAGLVAYNVYVVGSGPDDKMAAFNADFAGTWIHQVWVSVDDVWTATPYRKDLSIGGGKYRNDSHFGYLASELLVPSGNATETNDFSVDALTGKGLGGLWCPADLGVTNIHQSANAHLARIVLPEGARAALDLKVWNQNGDYFPMGQTVVPEPATLAMLVLGGVVMLRRKSMR
ncbi:MAG: PEP-CTERM sorting domain-containing protein [Phycisphaerae bacterium]|nr:PEP-CTERM sorting domain-containing protein [Phycisphaerae bacterium]